MKRRTRSTAKHAQHTSRYSYSSLLFAQPSFLGGAARLFDFGASLDQYNLFGLSPRDRDLAALYSDWLAIGQDTWTTFDRLSAQVHALASHSSE